MHDVGTQDGVPYVVTELLEGQSLREVALQCAPTQRQVLHWAVQTVQGLSAALDPYEIVAALGSDE